MTRGIPTNPENRSWSDDETAEMVKQWNAGKSAGEISKMLNCSRSRVCAKASRLREKGIISRDKASPATTDARRRTQKPIHAPRPKAAPRTTRPVTVRLVTVSTPTRVLPEKQKQVFATSGEDLPSLNMALNDLARSSCRWPTHKDASGDQLYCGHPATRKYYCEPHAAKMYARAS